MTTTTPIQAITANWINSSREIRIEGANADGTTFDQAISGDMASELIADMYEALKDHDEHFNVGAAFAQDPGRAA